MAKHLHKAKQVINDEFYTRYEDIQKEVEIYKDELASKIIYCNCDNWQHSNFVKYFKDNFKKFGLKSLIATGYEILDNGHYYRYDGKKEATGRLNGTGDFGSPECVRLLREADIVITNPPFSEFRRYIAMLMAENKRFLVIGGIHGIACKDVFREIKSENIRLGCNVIVKFALPNNNEKQVNCRWFTNLSNENARPFIKITKTYCPEKYPKYENYNAINCNKVADIPKGYYEPIGVPISFLDKYNEKQFEIIALGIIGSINFTKNRGMYECDRKTGEIKIKNNKPIKVKNAKGKLYTKFDRSKPIHNQSNNKSYKDIETGDYYSATFARIIIKHRK